MFQYLSAKKTEQCDYVQPQVYKSRKTFSIEGHILIGQCVTRSTLAVGGGAKPVAGTHFFIRKTFFKKSNFASSFIGEWGD